MPSVSDVAGFVGGGLRRLRFVACGWHGSAYATIPSRLAAGEDVPIVLTGGALRTATGLASSPP